MTESPPLFVSVVAPPKQRRSLAWAALGGLSLHAALLVFLVSVPAREVPPRPSAPAPLSVTLLDAPQVAGRRSEGLAGGEGSVVLGVATTTANRNDGGSTGAGGALGSARKRRRTTRGGAADPLIAQPGAREPTPPQPRPLPDEPKPQLSASSSASESPRVSTNAASVTGSTESSIPGGGGVGTGAGSARAGFGEGSGRGLSLDPVSGDTTVLAFGDGMKHPKLLSKVDPVFTKEAREARVQGLILTKCVITTAGRLRDCQIVKGIPMMNEQVLSALRQWRYEPVVYRDRPVSVRYLIPVRLQ